MASPFDSLDQNTASGRSDGVMEDERQEQRSVLQDSDMTPLTDTDTGSTSEEEGGVGWFGGIGTDFRNLALTIKDGIPPTIGALGDIANYVQNTALSVAAEIAQLEQDDDGEECSDTNGGPKEELRLPWEIPVVTQENDSDVRYEEDAPLKAAILELGGKHDTFLQPFSSTSTNDETEDESDFIVLDEPRVRLIRRLLELDERLAATHAHLSGRSDVEEVEFWTNYFHHCRNARIERIEELMSASIPAPVPNNNFDQENNDKPYDEDSVSRPPSQNSLVPVDAEPDEKDDDGDDDSFVCVNRSSIASPPCSLQSIEDLVLVNKMVQSANNY